MRLHRNGREQDAEDPHQNPLGGDAEKLCQPMRDKEQNEGHHHRRSEGRHRHGELHSVTVGIGRKQDTGAHGTGSREKRRRKRKHRDVVFRLRLHAFRRRQPERTRRPGKHHLDGDHEQDDAACRLQRGDGNAELPEQRSAGEGRDGKNAGGDRGGPQRQQASLGDARMRRQSREQDRSLDRADRCKEGREAGEKSSEH